MNSSATGSIEIIGSNDARTTYASPEPEQPDPTPVTTPTPEPEPTPEPAPSYPEPTGINKILATNWKPGTAPEPETPVLPEPAPTPEPAFSRTRAARPNTGNLNQHLNRHRAIQNQPVSTRYSWKSMATNG